MNEHKFTLSMTEAQMETLRVGLDHPKGHERVAYLFCRRAVMASETRFIAQSVEVVGGNGILDSSTNHVSVGSASYVPAMAKAAREGLSWFLVHTHPEGQHGFSEQDDTEELALFRTAFIRAPQGPHGSIILAGLHAPSLLGRVWINESDSMPMSRIRVVGKRLRSFDIDRLAVAVPPWADRQVRAFGKEIQRQLSTLHVGVVGGGGTGSAICEQLIRLGVGQLTVLDEQVFEDTNVNRVYGSSIFDVGIDKVNLVRKNAARIGTGTQVTGLRGSVCDLEMVRSLRSCELVFGCTDDHFGRAILNRLPFWYYIPVIDVAASIDSRDGIIRDILGRVTIVSPGNACLRCRGRISQDKVQAEMMRRANPDEYEARLGEGYAAELEEKDPAVVTFTTGVASRAVTEMLHMLTGFMGDDRTASEILERFHETEVRKNNVSSLERCFCGDSNKWGRGDQEPFLDLTWPGPAQTT